MKSQEKILKRIIDVVNKTAPSSEIYLYGSRVRGNANRLSDWDFLILLNEHAITFDFETKFMDEFYEIELETGEVISPLFYTKKDWIGSRSITPLYDNIQKEGIRIGEIAMQKQKIVNER